MELNLQYFGGRGSSGGKGGSADGRLSSSQIAASEKMIDKTAFQKVGNGHWEFPTDNATGIGASILDETGSSRDPMHGMGGKVYGVTTWGREPGDVKTSYINGSLNEAKTAAKEEMKGWLPSVRVKS